MIYPCKCVACGDVDVVAKASESGNLRCPNQGCGLPVEQNYAAKFAGGVMFATDALPQQGARAKNAGGLHGRLFDHQCSPAEAKQRSEALKEFGLGHVYKPDGTASVDSKGEMDRLVRAQGELLRRSKDPKKGKGLKWNGSLMG